MKLNPILQKLESKTISIRSKNQFHNSVKKGDLVSIIYYDIEKEQISPHGWGYCQYWLIIEWHYWKNSVWIVQVKHCTHNSS